MLEGFTVGITADRRWEEQASLFERRGASVLHGPVIRTLALGDDARLRGATEAVIARRPAIVIANTGVGIRSWFSAADTWGLGGPLTAALHDARIFARGPKASGAAHAHGLEVEARAGTERLSEAVDLALAVLQPSDVVVLQLDGRGTNAESERLRAAGADVIEVPVYEWQLPEDIGAAARLTDAVVAGRVHAVTFTAGPAITNWVALATDAGVGNALRERLRDGSIVVGCVGPVCAGVAEKEGIASDAMVMPAAARLGPLIRVVADALVARAIDLTVGDASVRLAGTSVLINGDQVTLTDIEAQLLRALASRPDTVLSKSDLLRIVWRDAGADPHVVETVVARLRRRLGPLGPQIASVYRRGYVLRTAA